VEWRVTGMTTPHFGSPERRTIRHKPRTSAQGLPATAAAVKGAAYSRKGLPRQAGCGGGGGFAELIGIAPGPGCKLAAAESPRREL